MKTTDLMIGDWVIAEGKQTQVTDIDEYEGINRRWIAGCEDGGCIHMSDVKPIPLTQEILEKNGFEKNEQDAIVITIRVYSLELVENSIALIEKPKGGYKFMSGNVGELSQQQMFFGNGNFMCYSIHNVHELQHAMKTCGIEKEIVL